MWALAVGPIVATEVCVNAACFDVEVAKTDAQRQRGLMFRQHLNKNAGMWFVFGAESIYPFWMKNTWIPLDIIWVNANRRVAHIQKNAVPFSEVPIVPSAPAKWVLEVVAGTVEQRHIKVGDPVVVKQ